MDMRNMCNKILIIIDSGQSTKHVNDTNIIQIYVI